MFNIVTSAIAWVALHDLMKCHFPSSSLEPFEKWGLDFIGPINPPSKNKEHILVCTDYVTKWVKVVALKHAQDTKVVEFLYFRYLHSLLHST